MAHKASTAPTPGINIIIPLGGFGKEFKDEDYTLPKPLVRVLGHPILYWLLDCIPKEYYPCTYIGANPNLREYDFDMITKKYYPGLNILELDGPTKGPAETILLTLRSCVPEHRRSLPFLSLDGDSFYTTNIPAAYGEVLKLIKCGLVFGFRDTHEGESQLRYSYAKMSDDGKICEIREKEKVGDFACSGAYGFPDGTEYVRVAEQLIQHKSTPVYNSHVIQTMIQEGKIFLHRELDHDLIHSLGTPLEVRIFANNVPANSALPGAASKVAIPKKRFCFDLDDTLVTEPEVPGDYRTVKPIQHRINFLRKLKGMGHYVIIQTARRMKTHHSNVGKIIADIGKITLESLENFGIPYDEIYFGKPFADYYIDDKAVLATFRGMERELGFYITTVVERDFHSLQGTVDTITKKATGENVNLEGEIWWYRHIPAEIADCFPCLLDYDATEGKSMVLERIQGYTLSALFSTREMKTDMVKHIVGTLRRIHRAKGTVPFPAGCSIYSNYGEKLKSRYNSYKGYAKFPNSAEVYQKLLEFCEEYEAEGRGICSLVHGDPVLTNILVNRYGKLKLIDMRGKLGSVVTQYGDANYDFAKLLQSLIGYDNVMHGDPINSAYRTEMVDRLKSELACDAQRWKDICFITGTLLFSLIPLHDNEKCAGYYDLISYALGLCTRPSTPTTA